MEDDFNTALRTLMRLRDAFEEESGTPANPRSQEALRMAETLRRWRGEYGTEELERLAEAHEGELGG